MRQLATSEEFRAAVAEAGLGELSADELGLLRTYYDDARAFALELRELVALDDEPATIFRAGPGS